MHANEHTIEEGYAPAQPRLLRLALLPSREAPGDYPGEQRSEQSVGKLVRLRRWFACGVQEGTPRPPVLAVRAGRPRASSGGRAPGTVRRW
jgi:hypothetical protein